MKKTGPLSVLVTILIIGFVVYSTYVDDIESRAMITQTISDKGGNVCKIENRDFFTGPFNFVAKGEVVYKIFYQDKNGELKEAWYRTSGKWDWKYVEN